MINMLKRLNAVLPDLLVLIFLYGLVMEGIGLCLVSDKRSYSVGLAVGILLAAGMAIHMATVIEDSLSVQDGKGRALVTIKGVLRYVVVVIVVAGTVYFELGNFLAIFVGIMGLKLAAYLQPGYRQLIIKRNKKKEVRG